MIGVTNPSYSYEWYALPVGSALNTTAHRIAGATEMTYKPTGADVGKEIVAITRFTDNGGYPLTATSPPIGPVRSSASIVGPRPNGFYINETIHVDTSGMNLQGVTVATTFTYRWVYVDGNGSVTGNPTGASSTMQSYTLTVNDAGKYMQVEITFTPTGSTPKNCDGQHAGSGDATSATSGSDEPESGCAERGRERDPDMGIDVSG